MDELIFRQVFPSAFAIGIGAGIVLASIVVVLVQRAARVWMEHARDDRRRERLRRLEARLRDAT